MTDKKTRSFQNAIKVVDEKTRVLEEIINLDNGFIGVRLDEDTVKLLEEKFREQGKDITIFCMVILGKNGGELFAVAKERVDDVKSFASKEALWNHMGMMEIGELECITVVRRKGDPPRLALDASVVLEAGKPCVEYGGMAVTGK
jgi:hypothetical protein